jgi:hypothetical protein
VLAQNFLRKTLFFTSFPQELFTQTREFDPVFDKRISILDADFNILSDYVRNFHAGSMARVHTLHRCRRSSENEDAHVNL